MSFNNPPSPDLHTGIAENGLWWSIRQEAKRNPVLKDMLDQVIEYYHLSKKGTK
jgi:hypothetical protein